MNEATVHSLDSRTAITAAQVSDIILAVQYGSTKVWHKLETDVFVSFLQTQQLLPTWQVNEVNAC